MTVTRRMGALFAALALLATMLVFGGQAFADDSSETTYPDEACAATERALEGTTFSLKSLESTLDANSYSTLSNGTIVVAIDAGHGTDPETGDYDSGAIGYGFDEAVANQLIAEACYNKINSYSGIRAIMVPKYRSVTQRVDWAIASGATLYVSLHNNSDGAGDGTDSIGCEVWIPNDSSYNYSCHQIGDDLAGRIQTNLAALGQTVRGTKTRDCTDGETYSDGHLADYYSANYEARQYGVCGFIVEHAFVNNASDNAKLQDASFCAAMGEADAQAIIDYYGATPVTRESCEAFVTRLYQQALGRDPDEAGKAANVEYLMNGGAAAQIAYNMFTSSEFEGRGLTNSEKINCVYQAMLNRSADSEGLSNWGKYLEAGMSAGSVAIGAAGSQEFSNRMGDIGVVAGTVSSLENRDRNYDVSAYVTRLYNLVLGRTFDISGLNAHTGAILSGAGAAEIARNFFVSGEFAEMGLSNEEAITRVYQVMLNRNPDAGGLANWLECLDANMSIVSVIAGFAGSDEFRNNCAAWGVNPGTVTITEARDQNRNVSAFITRLYVLVLDRQPEASGLNAHAGALLSGATAADIVPGFFLGPEFTGRSLTNEERVTICYKALLNRDPDASGLSDWTSRLDNGMPLSYLMAGFVDSVEFGNLCAQYGIQAGHIDFDASVMASYRTIPASEKYPIMGTSTVTADMLVAHFVSQGATYPSDVYASKGAATIQEFCQILVAQATSEGVRPEVLYAQAMHETGYLKFGGDVSADQCNFGGLGATGNGVKGNVFSSVSEGLLAQAQHLKCYASTDPLNNACVDQRWNTSIRGTAPYVEDLGGKWAVDSGYGTRLRAIINAIF